MHPALMRLLLALFQGSVSCNTALSLFMSVHTHTHTAASSPTLNPPPTTYLTTPSSLRVEVS